MNLRVNLHGMVEASPVAGPAASQRTPEAGRVPTDVGGGIPSREGSVTLPRDSARSAASSGNFWTLLLEMTRCEFKLRDQGTWMGFLWTLLYPAAMFLVLYGVFVKWMGSFVPQYALYLLIGLVQWNFFVAATSSGLSSLRRKAPLIKNFSFPCRVVVLSSVLVVALSYLLETGVLLVFLRLGGAEFRWTWLLLPACMAVLLLWVLGCSFFLSRLSLESMDMGRVWEIATSAGFFLTPVFYAPEILPGAHRAWLRLNPMAHLLDAFRDCLLRGRAPDVRAWLLMFSIGLAFAAAGAFYFDSREGSVADRLP